MTVAIALLFASCVRSELIGFDDSGNTPSGTGNNISFTLTIPYNNTTTKAYEGVDSGTKTENLINGVRIALYEDGLVNFSWDLDIKTKYTNDVLRAEGNDVEDYRYTGEIFEIQTKAKLARKGNYKMLVIVNPNDSVKTLTRFGSSINLLAAPFTPNTSAADSIYRIEEGTAAYFLMLNAQGLFEIKESDFHDTKDNAEANPVTGCSVERVAAKVSCTYSGPPTINASFHPSTRAHTIPITGRYMMWLPTIQLSDSTDYDIPESLLNSDGKMACPICKEEYLTQTNKVCSHCGYEYGYGEGVGATISSVRYMVATDLKWMVDITNKKSYWYRHLANKAGGSTMEKPGDTDRENFYAEDPNFSSISGTADTTTNFNYITLAQFAASAKKLAPSSSNQYPYADYWSWTEGDSQPVYIPENTMAQAEQKRDVTTRVIVKATLKREVFDSNKSSYQIGDFFVFRGGRAGDNRDNNLESNGNTYYILRPEDVAAYATGSPIPAALTPTSEGSTTLKQALDAFKTAYPNFSWTNVSNNTTPLITDHLLFYKNGEIYYEVPIEHFTADEAGVGGYGRFGVVRNNWYQLDIRNYLTLGYPTIPKSSAVIEAQ